MFYLIGRGVGTDSHCRSVGGGTGLFCQAVFWGNGVRVPFVGWGGIIHLLHRCLGGGYGHPSYGGAGREGTPFGLEQSLERIKNRHNFSTLP